MALLLTPDSPASERAALRQRLADLVGYRSTTATPEVKQLAVRDESWGRVEDVFLSGVGPGTVLSPEGKGPHPAVLYCHAHGGDYDLGRDELLFGSRFLAGQWGPVLAANGFVVLAIDMPGFGERREEGTESALAKRHLWNGGSLFAATLSDLSGALGYLVGRADVDETRIFSLGLSMGAAHATWLAALDRRIRGVVQMCMLADMGRLIEAGGHDRHGIYLTVPGLLTVCDFGDVAGLVAPRPQFVGLGTDDGLTPPSAREPALQRVRAAYESDPQNLEVYLEPDSGHQETPAMRAGALAFLNHHAGLPAATRTET